MGNSVLLSDDDAHRIREKVIKERNTNMLQAQKKKECRNSGAPFSFQAIIFD
jgi:hypothetical protein